MSFKDKKPNTIPEGYYYNASEMDVYLAIVEPKAEKWDKYTLDGKNITPEIIEQIEELEQKLEAIKKLHDRIIGWILHHRAESENATHWTEKWTHNLPSGAFHRVLDWIRTDLGLPPLEPLHILSIEDKILEAS